MSKVMTLAESEAVINKWETSGRIYIKFIEIITRLMECHLRNDELTIAGRAIEIISNVEMWDDAGQFFHEIVRPHLLSIERKSGQSSDRYCGVLFLENTMKYISNKSNRSGGFDEDSILYAPMCISKIIKSTGDKILLGHLS